VASKGSEQDRLAAKRRARRTSRHEHTREEILEAARKVVLKLGIGATTLEAVANEAGMSKTALYYYFPSKDALLFEVTFEISATLSQKIHDAVAKQPDGGGALRALIGTTVRTYGDRIDDFRLTFFFGQVAAPGTVRVKAEQLARIRPLNEIAFAETARKIAEGGTNKAGVDPRLMTFLAQMAAFGVLTMKGMVESLGDPLLYSDEQMIEALAAIFATAAEPADQGRATKKAGLETPPFQ
jgi:AcrR family transcriptional regulator